MTSIGVAKLLLFLAFAIPASIVDARTFRIPLWYMCIGIASLAVFCVFSVTSAVRGAVCINLAKSVVAAVVLFIGARLLTGGALGWGDVIFGAFAALYTGFPLVFFAIAFAALGGMLFYLALAVLESHRKKEHFVFRPIFAIPFVPFISFGALLAVILF